MNGFRFASDPIILAYLKGSISAEACGLNNPYRQVFLMRRWSRDWEGMMASDSRGL
jgi:hypothetical protein